MTELRGAKGNFPPGMAGSSAILHGRYGAGRVVLISPHIESSVDAPTATLFCNLFRLAADAAAASLVACTNSSIFGDRCDVSPVTMLRTSDHNSLERWRRI